MFEPGMMYWIASWVLMTLAFLAAFCAILVGTKKLDQQAQTDEPNGSN